jgi:hypothetical protein
MKLRVSIYGALALLLLSGCGGSSSMQTTPAVVHLTWAGAPSITKVRLTVMGNFNYQQQRVATRAAGDVDVILALLSGNSVLRIEGLGQNDANVSGDVSGPAVADATVHVGGVPTQCAIFQNQGDPPINNTSVPLPVDVGGDFMAVPTDAQNAVVLLPASDLSYSFTDASVVNYTAPFFISGKLPGSTQVDLMYQANSLGHFGVIVTP